MAAWGILASPRRKVSLKYGPTLLYYSIVE